MTKSMNLSSRLECVRLVAVVMIDKMDQVGPLAKALRDGGIRAVELTLRTPAALEALGLLRRKSPEFLIGAGTVLTPEQADEANEAGADFALAPGLDAATVRRCAEIGLPFIPGVATPSDVQAAIALGCRLLKFFPAEPHGGVRGLRILAAPFAHMGVRYLPLGGIDAASAAEYLAEPGVAAVGGSWIAPPDLIRNGDWDSIRQRATEAVRLASANLPVSA